MENKKVVLDVFQTDDTSVFKRMEGNRDPKCVKKIVDSIKRVGYIPNPIIVNENMEIIDGQNRVLACEKLNLPVMYYIVKGADIDTARSLNLGRTNWKPIDYIKSYAESGNKSYQLFLKLINENQDYSMQEIYGVMSERIIANGFQCDIVASGNLEVTEEMYKETSDILETIRPINAIRKEVQGAGRTFVSGVAWCIRLDGCNRKRMIDVILKGYPKIRPVCNIENLLYDLTKIYNSHLASDKMIDFDVTYRRQRR